MKTHFMMIKCDNIFNKNIYGVLEMEEGRGAFKILTGRLRLQAREV